MATTRCSLCTDLVGGVHNTNSSTRYRYMQRWIERQNLNPILPRPIRAIASDVAALLAEFDEEQRAEWEAEQDETEGNTFKSDNIENLINGIDPGTDNSVDEVGNIDFTSGSPRHCGQI